MSGNTANRAVRPRACPCCCDRRTGLVWLTPKEAAAKIICSVHWLISKGIREPHKIPYRPWGRTYRFIAEDIDAWAGGATSAAGRAHSAGLAPSCEHGSISDGSVSSAGSVWLTPELAAQKLKVSVKWLKSTGIKSCGIPHKKLGKSYRFTAEAIDAYPGFRPKTKTRNQWQTSCGLKKDLPL